MRVNTPTFSIVALLHHKLQQVQNAGVVNFPISSWNKFQINRVGQFDSRQQENQQPVNRSGTDTKANTNMVTWSYLQCDTSCPCSIKFEMWGQPRALQIVQSMLWLEEDHRSLSKKIYMQFQGAWMFKLWFGWGAPAWAVVQRPDDTWGPQWQATVVDPPP